MLKRPLYKVDCGELTADGLFAVEGKLSRLLELAAAVSSTLTRFADSCFSGVQ